MMQPAGVSTRDIAPRERLSWWDAQLWRDIGPLRTRSASVPFEGEAARAAMGPLYLIRIAASAHRLERESSAERSGLAALFVQRRGTAAVAQGGRETALDPGDWALCDLDRTLTVSQPTAGEQLVLVLPRDRLGLGTAFAGATARAFGQSGTARLLPAYLAGLIDELGAVADGHGGELADMAAQLARLALSEARQAQAPVSMRETLRLRVKDYVRRNLRDPALSIDRVAAAFGCTKRHLHKVFAGDATTLSQFIWMQRLDCCRDALGNPGLARHSITEIAFMWGFNNSAHFSKAFKERFGLPPGSFRQRAAA